MKCFATAFAVSFACLCMPGVASADSGSITNVSTLPSGEVQGTYTATGTSCETDGFCAYFPYAVEVSSAEACRPYYTDSGEDGSRLTWVGEVQDQFTSQSGSAPFRPNGDAVRICLYVRGTARPHVLVAEYIHNVRVAPTPPPPPPPAPPTTTTTTPVSQVVPPMGIGEAKRTLPSILREEMGRSFKRSSLTRSCYRLNREKVRCQVSWTKRPYKYRGKVTVWNDPADPASSLLYNTSITRKRLASRSGAPTRLAAEMAADRRKLRGSLRAVAAKSCSAGYTHAAISGSHKCLAGGE